MSVCVVVECNVANDEVDAAVFSDDSDHQEFVVPNLENVDDRKFEEEQPVGVARIVDRRRKRRTRTGSRRRARRTRTWQRMIVTAIATRRAHSATSLETRRRRRSRSGRTWTRRWVR